MTITHELKLLPPGDSEVKASACSVGDPGSIPGSGRSPGEGNGNPLQYSCLENPMDGGAWQATVYGVAKSRTRLSNFTHSLNIVSKKGNQVDFWLLFFLCGGGLVWFLIFIKIQLLYNVVLASTVQQSESAIQIHTTTLFLDFLPIQVTTEH